jgi:hypothetical protein
MRNLYVSEGVKNAKIPINIPIFPYSKRNPGKTSRGFQIG